jgi:5-deoxy-glucuronate isomerase
MNSLLVKARRDAAGGCVAEVTPQSAGWRYVGFKAFVLSAGASMRGGEPGRETCIVVLSGTAAVRAGSRTYEDVGSRASVFQDAPPGAVYLPAGERFQVIARTRAEVAICSAPGSAGPRERRIDAATMTRETRGSGTNTRYVRNILPQDEDASSLLVVEVVTPGGHWSSYPPHKHDTDAGTEETALEETYYHRLNPPQGFAFQRVYTDDRSIDATHCVEDGDVVTVPRGYHPVGAPHGYDLYYLNVMAGPRRQWIFRNDPRHEWMLAKR